VIARVVGAFACAFAEIPPGTYALAGPTSSVLANEYCLFFADRPSEAKSMLTQRLYRSLGLAAHFGWACLLTDRCQDLVEIPAPSRQGLGGRHHFTPGDEGAPECEN
jgi:hypothetical protein